jgi:hypothetical protein
MKDISLVLQRLRELVVRLANTKWDVDDTVREQAAHEVEWSDNGYSKNILDVFVISLIRYALYGELDSKKAQSAYAAAVTDFTAVKYGKKTVTGYLAIREAAKDDPLLGVHFAEALDQRLDRFEAYADVPFPGKTLKT